MQIFKKMKLKNKLVGLLVLPLSGLLMFSINSINNSIHVLNQMNSLRNLTTFSVYIANVVHETQKERGLTAGYLANKSDQFAKRLIEQRQTADEKIKAYEEFYNNFDQHTLGNEFIETIKGGQESLKRIEEIRQKVDSDNIKTGDAIAYYTNLNKVMLDSIIFMTQLSDSVEITNYSSAYVNFLLSKERSGIERAVMSNVFELDKFSPALYQKFITLLSEQKTYMDVFLSFANKTQRKEYMNIVSGRSIEEVARMENIALTQSAGGNFGVKATYWFDMMTQKSIY